MVKLNGNIPNINLGLSIGVISLMVFTIIVGGYFIDDTHKSSQNNGDTINNLKKTVNGFIDKWEQRLKISNQVNNLTQERLLSLGNISQEQEEQLLDLARNQTLILDQQIINEKNLQGNLTAHRHVANTTRDATYILLNHTLTGEQYGKLADKRVNNIIGNLSAEHERILELLNKTQP